MGSATNRQHSRRPRPRSGASSRNAYATRRSSTTLRRAAGGSASVIAGTSGMATTSSTPHGHGRPASAAAAWARSPALMPATRSSSSALASASKTARFRWRRRRRRGRSNAPAASHRAQPRPSGLCRPLTETVTMTSRFPLRQLPHARRRRVLGAQARGGRCVRALLLASTALSKTRKLGIPIAANAGKNRRWYASESTRDASTPSAPSAARRMAQIVHSLAGVMGSG